MLARRRAVLSLLASSAVGLAWPNAAGAAAGAKRAVLPDPLDTPAQPSAAFAKAATAGIAHHGERLVAVGPRGLILLSTDAAARWQQVASPVGTDLVSVKFVDANTVWAVGHDAVALRSADGGASWQKVLDGRSVLTLLRTTYSSGAKAGDVPAAAIAREIERSIKQSATPDVFPEPFLDVWFADANEGFLVGAFGLVLHTADGGRQWEPWIERLDNERRFHLYAMTGDAAHRYIAGEQGLLLQFDAAAQRFVALQTPYNGTFFGVHLRGERLMAFGLRGNVFVRPTEGADWIKTETGVDANIVAAVAPTDDRLLLVSQAGQLLDVSPDGRRAVLLKSTVQGEVLGAVAVGPRRLALARVGGVAALDIAGAGP